MLILSVKSVLGLDIELTSENFDYIKEKHTEVSSLQMEQISKSISEPDFVSVDKDDPSVFLYHKLFTRTNYGPKMCIAVAKHLKDRGFIITVYLSSKIRRGRVIWLR